MKKDGVASTGCVTQIHAPSKNEQHATHTPPLVQYAADKHRVPVQNFSSTTSPTDAAQTGGGTTGTAPANELKREDAVVDLELTKAYAALRANLDEGLFRDLESLGISQLRVHVV